MSDLPAPLVPADLDLRDFPFMPVDVRRLLTSETWLTATGDQKSAAMTLWLESWHQVPAGSLPDNDRMLSILSQAGGKWKKVKAAALRGWVKADDGRLYHPVVCEKAIEAGERKQAQAEKRNKDAERLKRWREQNRNANETPDETTNETTDETRFVAERQGQGHTSSLRSDEARAIESEFRETFWPKYPHKVEKPAALKAWKTARKKADLATIMSGLDRYMRSKPPDLNWCNPATFLNRERWTDEPSFAAAPGNGGGNGSETRAPDWKARAAYFRKTGQWRDEWGDRSATPAEFAGLFVDPMADLEIPAALKRTA